MSEGITGMLINSVGLFFSPLAGLNPAISLFVVVSFITVLIILLNRKFTNTEAMKEIKDKMKGIREQLDMAQKQGDKETANKLLGQIMEMNSEFMRHSYKSLFISLIVITLFLPWIKQEYSGMAVANLPFKAPFVGSSLNWIGWYILVSFTIGWIVRKLFGFD